jgi:molybdopterin-guanine dinucleotide biosynthesis protein MobB
MSITLRRFCMKVIAIVGAGRRSGKTTTVEALLREFSSCNFKVGTIKQIYEEDFSLDTPQKDTWRHAEAGAKIVVSAAPREVAAIKRLKGEDKFEEALRLLQGEELDLVIVEGNPPVNVPRVLVTRDGEKAKKMIERLEGVVCISSMTPEKFNKAEFNRPIFHPIKDAARMVALLKEHLS